VGALTASPVSGPAPPFVIPTVWTAGFAPPCPAVNATVDPVRAITVVLGGLKVAVTVRSAVMLSEQVVAVPEHAPDHPVNTDVPVGVAVKTCVEPAGERSPHAPDAVPFVIVQVKVPSVTVPVPVPAPVMIRSNAGLRTSVTVTFCGLFDEPVAVTGTTAVYVPAFRLPVLASGVSVSVLGAVVGVSVAVSQPVG